MKQEELRLHILSLVTFYYSCAPMCFCANNYSLHWQHEVIKALWLNKLARCVYMFNLRNNANIPCFYGHCVKLHP